MTKVKSGAKAMDRSPTAHFKAVKNNSIQKKKNNKFANTPTGKIRLVNGKKAQNNDKMENKLNIKEKEKPQVIKDSPDSPDSNKSSPRNNDKKNSPKEILNVTKALNSPNKQSGKNKKRYIKNLVDKEDESDESLEDINEGVVLPDDSIISQDDNDDDDDETNEEESDIDLPNILGQSLADDTDEDDSDFDEEEDDEDDHDHDSDEDGVSQLKGVKMFKGLLKQKFDSVKKNENDKDEDEDEEDDEEDDDADMDESNLETDTSGRIKNKKGNVSTTEDEEEGDEDSEEDENEDEEEEDDDDDEESTPGLKDLLGNSIADDENDEDFEGEDEDDDDIDISDEESEADADESNVEQRTIYVGNVPKDSKKQEIKKVFKEFGSIKSIRIRNVAPPNIKVSKKVAAITKQIHQDIDHVSMLIVFQNAESASKALCMNGKKFKGHYLRVDTTEKVKTQPDPKKAVFLGNLPFTINDNNIWEHFEQCGEIDFVRLIRDKKTRIGKGIGYVNFKNEDSVPLALELDGSTLLNREIRVKRHFDKASGSKSEQKPKDQRNKRSHPAGSRVKKSPKKLKVNDEEVKTSPIAGGTKKLKAKGKSQENSSPISEKKKTVFQGQKAAAGKKTKKSKLDKKKKKIAAVLTAKPKKVQKV